MREWKLGSTTYWHETRAICSVSISPAFRLRQDMTLHYKSNGYMYVHKYASMTPY